MKNLFNIRSEIFLDKDNKNFIGKVRIELLENIEIYGSISKAAKNMKMSYKSAWDNIDSINKLSPSALVTKVSGGKGGGGTVITAYAKELIKAYKEIEELNSVYSKLLSNSLNEKMDLDYKEAPSFTRLKAYINKLDLKKDFYEIEIVLESKQKLYSINSKEFVQKKELKLNQNIKFVIETSTITIHKDLNKTSARNVLKGVITSIEDDGINVNLQIDCNEGDIIYAKITSSSCKSLDLKINTLVFAQFKAYNISII